MSNKYFTGLLFIFLGIGFLLDKFAILEFSNILSVYWPSIIILLGLTGLFNRRSSKKSSIIVLIIGVLLQIQKLDILEFNVTSLIIPIILIYIGLNIIFSRGSNGVSFNYSSGNTYRGNIDSEDKINYSAMWSGIDAINQSQSLKGGTITAIMGGVELDLRDAKLDNNKAYLETTAIMGGIDISVPKEWRVEMSGMPIFGGWSNKAKHNGSPEGPVLKVKCTVLFGGVEIK